MQPGGFSFTGFVLVADPHVTLWFFADDPVAACCQAAPYDCPEYLGSGLLVTIAGVPTIVANSPALCIVGQWQGETLVLDVELTRCANRAFTVSATRVAKKPGG